MNGHQSVAQTLKTLGITHVYCLSGGAIRETLPACSQVGIRAIGVRHQQAAVLMAAAHNYRAGQIVAVAMVSAGPAITNAATGILVAWDNCWPVLVIAGLPGVLPSSLNSPKAFQAFEGVPVFHSITKWSAQVPSSKNIGATLTHGFQIASSDRPGPVYLEIPECALKSRVLCHSTVQGTFQSQVPCPPEVSKIEKAAHLLRHSQRTGVILGKGLRWTKSLEDVRSLIETYRLPFITSPMGRGYLPDDHPLCFNNARDVVQNNADTILVIGARLNWTFRFGKQFSREANVIHIDIAQEELANKTPRFLGLKGDIQDVLTQLLDAMQRVQPSLPKNINKGGTWLEYLRTIRAKQQTLLEKKINISTIPISPHRLMKEIRDFLPRDAICVLDGRDAMAAAQEVLLSYEPASRFTAGSNGCMGVGIPFGIGAKLSAPDRLVVVVTGDMAFGIAAMEMETAVRHKIPIIVVIVNNDGGCATSVHRDLYPADHEAAAMFQPRLQYEKIMEACGGYAESIDQPEQIQPALHRALESGIPACLNVYVDPNAPFKNYLG